jgi:predicted metalloprotease with PDZ domain
VSGPLNVCVRRRAKITHAVLLFIFSTLSFSQARAADEQPPTRYTVSLARSAAHVVRVKIELPPGPSQRDLQLPVWDSLYQVRDFSQYVGSVRARDGAGQSLSVRKIEKSLWRVSGTNNGAGIEYETYAAVSGPYGAELNTHHAFFNLAQILMYPVEARSAPIQIRFTDLPPTWQIATALDHSSAGEFLVPNYDRLVDSPVEIGAFQESDFDQGGGHYRVVVDAEPSDYDMENVVSTARRIVASETAWMNERPFQNYLFLYHFPRTPGGGGMEHAYCTAIEVSAQVLIDDPLSLAGVTAHEFFHVWNVKRILPQSLVPRDYTKENYTPALWFSEGVTNTLEVYTLLRAGFIDERQYLMRLAESIREYERLPARATQSAEEASVDAWLEKYDYYRAPQRSISYYNKGELLGVLLDLSVRESSHGSASLRDIFRWMNVNDAQRGRPFADSEGVREAAEAVGHGDLKMFFQKYVSGMDEIPWDNFFRGVGLHLERKQITVADLGFWTTRNFGMPPIVASVRSGGEAERDGLTSGDSILEINGQIAGRNFEEQLLRLRPGDTLRLKIRDAQGKREVHWKVAGADEVHVELKDLDDITDQQKANREAWLKDEPQTAGDAHP